LAGAGLGAGPAAGTGLHVPLAGARPGAWARGYIVALLAATLALLVRAALDPLLASDHALVLDLLAVVYVAWQCGFGPGVATLLASMTGTIYFFVEPRETFVVANQSDQIAVAAFFFCGVGCAALGGSQRAANARAKAALADALDRQAALEGEVARRRAAEAELAETAATLRAFYDSAPLCMGVVEPTPDGDILHVYDNRASCKFFGVCADGTTGRRASALGVGPDTARLWLDKYREAGGRNGPVGFDYRYDRADGPGWLSATVSPLGRGPSGRPRFCYVAEDVTDRRRAEAELRASEERFRQLAETIPQLAWMARPDGHIFWYNRRWYEYTGATPDRMEGWGWEAVHDPAVLPEVMARWKHSIDTGEPFNMVFPLKGADGEFRPFLTLVNPLRDAAGRILFWFGTNTDISEQKRAEADLERRVSERTADLNREREFLRAVLENIEDAVVACDAGGRLTLFNRATLTLHGLPPEPIPSDEWAAHYRLLAADGITPLAPAEVPLYRALGGEHVRNAEMVVVPAGGGPGRALLASGQPILDDAGRKLGAVVSMHDVTDRLAAEAARAEVIRQQAARVEVARSEARFRTLTEAVPHVVWNADPAGRVTYFNTRWREYTGVTVEAAAADGWLAAVHPADRDRVAAAWRETVGTAAAGPADRFTQELRLRRAGTDEYRWFLTVAVPLRRPGGAVDQWIGSMADIDDQRRLADQLGQAAERFRQLTEAVPQMVWTADPAGTVTYFNRRWTEYTGLALTDMTGDRAAGLIHPDDAAGLDATWKAAVAGTDGRYAHEFRLRRQADGEYRWMLSNALALGDPAGRAAEWVGTLTDIDDQKRQAETLDRLVRERTAELQAANAALRDQIEERRRAEEQVEAVARELRRSNRELEQFAYVASHDLQEPLRKIQAFGDLLGNKYAAELPDQGREYVGKMQGSAGRMSRLIDDLLTYSRVTTHAKPFARVDLNVILAEVVDDLEVRIEKSGGTVDAGPLPAIDADPTQMRQVFQNLLGNALKFAHPGRPPVVTVRGELPADAGANGHPGGVCRITVSDNGIGFEDRFRDRIFQVFQRLHGRDEYDGTGVGLAVCKKIVERHGGTITANGRPGEGATFVITLPAHQPEPPVPPPPADTPTPARG
ncbi:MAG: PAS domain S-box protein, partial [Gemmataceae bacterium]|nr:PAS domain S-box protein [Gemmataceae bacterium]